MRKYFRVAPGLLVVGNAVWVYAVRHKSSEVRSQISDTVKRQNDFISVSDFFCQELQIHVQIGKKDALWKDS